MLRWPQTRKRIVTAATLEQQPNLNVSRLVCPRRRLPGPPVCRLPRSSVRFGVRRGLTGEAQPRPEGGVTCRPPLPGISTAGGLTLPVYFHWEFATGPVGDFEELARRLDPSLPAYRGVREDARRSRRAGAAGDRGRPAGGDHRDGRRAARSEPRSRLARRCRPTARGLRRALDARPTTRTARQTPRRP